MRVHKASVSILYLGETFPCSRTGGAYSSGIAIPASDVLLALTASLQFDGDQGFDVLL